MRLRKFLLLILAVACCSPDPQVLPCFAPSLPRSLFPPSTPSYNAAGGEPWASPDATCGGGRGARAEMATTRLSPKNHWEVRVGEARRARGDALLQILDVRRGAEALLLFPSWRCPCHLLTLGSVVGATPPTTTNFGASGLSRRRRLPAPGSGLLPT